MAGDKLTDEFLMQVADVWRQAYGAADPVEAVREAGNTTRQTARAWITAARNMLRRELEAGKVFAFDDWPDWFFELTGRDWRLAPACLAWSRRSAAVVFDAAAVVIVAA